jgi:hypothetical protein
MLEGTRPHALSLRENEQSIKGVCFMLDREQTQNNMSHSWIQVFSFLSLLRNQADNFLFVTTTVKLPNLKFLFH